MAYALAKFRFRGRRIAMLLVISTMMLPPQVIVIPMYLVWAQQLHLSGSLWPLIIPMAFGDAYSIFLLRQFLLTIPQEYIESAKVDGCGEVRTLLRIVVPMAKPGIAAVALFQFFSCWNRSFLHRRSTPRRTRPPGRCVTASNRSRARTTSTGT
ncbi:L-arabinose transport system permease protein AraQ [Streptomyces rimosus subsp. rimosus]